MSASLIFGLLRFLPAALEAGVAVGGIIADSMEKAQPQPQGSIEEFARGVIQSVPSLLSAGVAIEAVTETVKRTNEAVSVMLREGRGPSDAEWADQAARIKALEERLDVAAKRS